MKQRDTIIFSLIAILFGIFVMRQLVASREARKLAQPENNQVMALEVAHLTKSTSELRRELANSEDKVSLYQKSLSDQSTALSSIENDLKRYREINATTILKGRGVVLTINKKLSQIQMIDLTDTIRNIGVSGFMVNGLRITHNFYFSESQANTTKIEIVGNPTLLRSAITRKGGYLDQLYPNALEYSISETDTVELPAATVFNYQFSKIIN